MKRNDIDGGIMYNNGRFIGYQLPEGILYRKHNGFENNIERWWWWDGFMRILFGFMQHFQQGPDYVTYECGFVKYFQIILRRVFPLSE